MDILGTVTVIILFIITVFHLYWALGGKASLSKALPSKDGKFLFKPTRLLTFFVCLVLSAFLYVAYVLVFNDMALLENKIIYQTLGMFLAVLFLLRAIGDFNMVGIFKKIKNTQFAFYDTYLFIPLCLFLSFSFVVLSYRI